MAKLFLIIQAAKPAKWLRRVLMAIGATAPAPLLAQASFLNVEPINPHDEGGSEFIEYLLVNIIDFAVGLLVVLAVTLIVYAAYLYLFAGGEAEKIGTAKKWLVYVVVAIAVALLSRVLVFIIFELFGQDAPGGEII